MACIAHLHERLSSALSNKRHAGRPFTGRLLFVLDQFAVSAQHPAGPGDEASQQPMQRGRTVEVRHVSYKLPKYIYLYKLIYTLQY